MGLRMEGKVCKKNKIMEKKRKACKSCPVFFHECSSRTIGYWLKIAFEKPASRVRKWSQKSKWGCQVALAVDTTIRDRQLQSFDTAEGTFAAANIVLQLQACIFQRQLYLCSGKINFAATNLPLTFPATNISRLEVLPKSTNKGK